MMPEMRLPEEPNAVKDTLDRILGENDVDFTTEIKDPLVFTALDTLAAHLASHKMTQSGETLKAIIQSLLKRNIPKDRKRVKEMIEITSAAASAEREKAERNLANKLVGSGT